MGQVIKKGEGLSWVHPEAEAEYNAENDEVKKNLLKQYNGNMDKILEDYSRRIIELEIGKITSDLLVGCGLVFLS